MDDVIEEFLVESQEAIEEVEGDLVALEEDGSPERIQRIFRNVHTVKGTCGFLGFEKLEGVGHAAENLLSLLRSGEREVDEEITSILLASVDAMRQMLVAIEQTETDGEEAYESLVAELERIIAARPVAELANAEQHDAADDDTSSVAHAPDPTVEDTPVEDTPVEHALAAKVEAALTKPETEKTAVAEKTGEPRVAESSIRVSVELLDTLMNLVGELVLVRNQLLQMGQQGDAPLVGATQRLNHVTAELQEGVMRTRMQPIGHVWGKLPRVVRDLAHSLGKKVKLQLDGRETELDKTILEAIKDPLTHLVRNAVDHGIESTVERLAAGKPEEGTLRLRAYHEGGQVMLEITDDGGGIDPARIVDKALARGLVTRDALERMSERAVFDFIFHPGFSTAAKVTHVSGRGVGLDVVKTNIERIGGSIDVQSSSSGTTFRIRIPLTLAIVPALIVVTGGDRFAIPQVSLVELVRLEDVERSVEYVHGTPVYRLRGDLLPLVYLHDQLGIEAQPVDEATHIAVLQAGDQLFGLVVEEIRDTEEIVVKALSRNLKALGVYSGATIMGDGRVALILDAVGLARRAGLDAKTNEAIREEAGEHHLEEETLLLLALGDERHVAVPLSTVERLEEIETTRLERAGVRTVVQYRGEILALRDLGTTLYGEPTSAGAQVLQVVVLRHEGGCVGLAVERLVDIVEERYALDRSGAREGVLGSAIVNGRVVEVLDVGTLLGGEERGGAMWMS